MKHIFFLLFGIFLLTNSVCAQTKLRDDDVIYMSVENFFNMLKTYYANRDVEIMDLCNLCSSQRIQVYDDIKTFKDVTLSEYLEAVPIGECVLSYKINKKQKIQQLIVEDTIPMAAIELCKIMNIKGKVDTVSLKIYVNHSTLKIQRICLGSAKDILIETNNNTPVTTSIDLPEQVNTDIKKNDIEIDIFVDERDGRPYQTVEIGSQVWFAENVAYKTKEGCWDAGKAYGLFYTWKAAQKVCPKGWHLPSNEEWSQLVTAVGGQREAGGRLTQDGYDYWPRGNTANNSSGFSALPAGCRRSENILYVGSNAFWWTANTATKATAIYRDINYNSNLVGEFAENIDFGMSVRCVKD